MFTLGNNILTINNNIAISYDVNAAALINRMIAAGEQPTNARQQAINKCIISLKANNLFDTQFDVLVVTRGTGLASTKMNWIKNANNATGVPNGGTLTYTQDVGYHSDATNSYINTNYNPTTNGVLYTLNDACFGFKLSGTINTMAFNGAYDTKGIEMGNYYADVFYGFPTSRINGSAVGGFDYNIGYNQIIRSGATAFYQMLNSTILGFSNASVALVNVNLYMLNIDVFGSPFPGFFTSTTEIYEAYWMGKSMTQTQFLVFQTIMNTYFATF